jgi:hypothetical protein
MHKKYKTLLTLTIGAITLIISSGCSTYRPHIDTPDESYQAKLNTGHDWRLMAQTVTRNLQKEQNIQLVFESDSLFAESYKGILIQELTSRGYRINDYAPTVLEIDYTVVNHGHADERNGLLTRTTKGVQHFFTGNTQGKYSIFGDKGTEHEVITSHKLKGNGVIEDAYTTITYFPVSDKHLYKIKNPVIIHPITAYPIK